MNLIGKALTRCYAARQTLARLTSFETPPVDPRAEELSREGIVVLKDLLPSELVSAINRDNERWFDFEHPTELVYSPDGKKLLEAASAPRAELEKFYFLHVKNYQRKYDVFQDIVPRIDPILRTYYHSRYHVRDVYCYRSQPIPEVQGSYSWHQDNYPPGSLKVMVYLTEVTAEHGPFTIALGSHAGFQPELGRIGDRHEDAPVRASYRVLDCLGGPGTVIVFNNNTIHRATDLVRGHRDVINFTVFPAVLPTKPDAVKGLDLDEEKTFLKRYTR